MTRSEIAVTTLGVALFCMLAVILWKNESRDEPREDDELLEQAGM